jgi:dTDP-4-dehydrorhamnose reductase
MMKNIIIFGKNGQVGSNLVQILAAEGNFIVKAFSSSEVDFSDLKKLREFLENLQTKPDFIINAAAYTNVDKAEDETKLADLINHQSVAIIANYCAKNQIKLIHYSTDYVFDGSGDEPFAEDNSKNLHPLNHYGKTKLDGEKAIIASGCDYLIIRISWVWDSNPNSKNFVNTIARLAKEQEEISVVDDQIGSPTSAHFVAENTIKIIKKLSDSADEISKHFPNRIYHLNNGKYISWYDFAVEIIDNLKRKGEVLRVKKINPIKTSKYKTKATRPLNSRLKPSQIFSNFS